MDDAPPPPITLTEATNGNATHPSPPPLMPPGGSPLAAMARVAAASGAAPIAATNHATTNHSLTNHSSSSFSSASTPSSAPLAAPSSHLSASSAAPASDGHAPLPSASPISHSPTRSPSLPLFERVSAFSAVVDSASAASSASPSLPSSSSTSAAGAAAAAAAAPPPVPRISLTLPPDLPQSFSLPSSSRHSPLTSSNHTAGTVPLEDDDDFSEILAANGGEVVRSSLPDPRVAELQRTMRSNSEGSFAPPSAPAHSSDPSRPISPMARKSARKWMGTMDRSKSELKAPEPEKWTNLLVNMKKKYVPPPFASFVSHQLHKYLITVNPDDNETATGFTMPGAVLFSDASGFTAMTERLAKRKDGAEVLCEIINRFFAQLIEIVHKYAGDIVKFAGDAVSIVWPVNPHEAATTTGYISPDLTTATLRACACSCELHEKLHGFVAIDDPDPSKRVLLKLHMGIGCGQLTAVHVGGVFRRWEYILAGPPMAQIAVAEPLAKPGETVVSPEAWLQVCKKVTGVSVVQPGRETDPKLSGYMVLRKVTVGVPIPLIPLMLPVTEAVGQLMRRYIPHAVLPKLERNQDGHVAELREVSVVFVNVQGVELGAREGELSGVVCKESLKESVRLGQMLMLEIQRTVYSQEGSINKLLVDDKGLLVLCAWGLPPVPHYNDAMRAVAAAMNLVDNLQRLGDGVHGRVGVATGRAFCGVVGSPIRREYTLMGDVVNLAARLMGVCEPDGVLVDEVTQVQCIKHGGPFNFKELDKKLTLKGKADLVAAFRPIAAPMARAAVAAKDVNRENMYGREAELAELASSVDRLAEAKGGVVFLTGDRGSGKTLLVDRIVVHGADKNMSVLRSQEGTAPVSFQRHVSSAVQRSVDRLLSRAQTETDESTTFMPMFTAWRSIFESLIDISRQETGLQATAWLAQALAARNEEDSEDFTPHMFMLHSVIPDVISRMWVESHFLKLGADLPVEEAILRKMLTRLILRFSDTHPTLILLHLKTGTEVTSVVDPESWQLAESIGNFCMGRAGRSEHAMILCVVTRSLTKNRVTPSVSNVASLGEACQSFLQLRPLDTMRREKYAAQVLGYETQREVKLVAMPPVLLQLLSDRAAGNPKHIMEMMQELLDKDHPALRLLENGRVEILRDLDTVPTPAKMRGAVKQEFDQLPEDLQVICRVAIMLRSFTPQIVLELIQQMDKMERGIVPANLTYATVTQAFSELVAFGIFENTMQPTLCVKRYYPFDFHTNTFQFVSKLLQAEVAAYQTALWKNRLEAIFEKRTNMVMTAYHRLIRFFRRLRERRLIAEQKRMFRAAYIIQTKYRVHREKRQMRASLPARPYRQSRKSEANSSDQHTTVMLAGDMLIANPAPMRSADRENGEAEEPHRRTQSVSSEVGFDAASRSRAAMLSFPCSAPLLEEESSDSSSSARPSDGPAPFIVSTSAAASAGGGAAAQHVPLGLGNGHGAPIISETDTDPDPSSVSAALPGSPFFGRPRSRGGAASLSGESAEGSRASTGLGAEGLVSPLHTNVTRLNRAASDTLLVSGHPSARRSLSPASSKNILPADFNQMRRLSADGSFSMSSGGAAALMAAMSALGVDMSSRSSTTEPPNTPSGSPLGPARAFAVSDGSPLVRRNTGRRLPSVSPSNSNSEA